MERVKDKDGDFGKLRSEMECATEIVRVPASESFTSQKKHGKRR